MIDPREYTNCALQYMEDRNLEFMSLNDFFDIFERAGIPRFMDSYHAGLIGWYNPNYIPDPEKEIQDEYWIDGDGELHSIWESNYHAAYNKETRDYWHQAAQKGV